MQYPSDVPWLVVGDDTNCVVWQFGGYTGYAVEGYSYSRRRADPPLTKAWTAYWTWVIWITKHTFKAPLFDREHCTLICILGVSFFGRCLLLIPSLSSLNVPRSWCPYLLAPLAVVYVVLVLVSASTCEDIDVLSGSLPH